MFTGLALVAIILLINAMKLEELVILIRETLGGRISQRLGNRPRQKRVARL